MHNKKGYILFLVFSILAMCTLLITIFFARTITYHNVMHVLTTKQRAANLALGSTVLGQAMLYVPVDKKNLEPEKKEKAAEQNSDQKLFQKILPYIYRTQSYKLTQEVEGMDATLIMKLSCEEGKLNINSLYDFSQKKFVNEGEKDDRKKFCQWLFGTIAKITEQSTLFDAFEKHLKNRTSELNDVTELLHIPEFEKVFGQTIFYNPSQKEVKLYLTDIFTTSTQSYGINPWFLTQSWRIMLELEKDTTLSSDEMQQLMKNFKKKANWESDWDNSVKLLYQKEYKDLPQEIKSMLTTDFEANIFSLLSKTIIGETISTIFTILKANTKNKPAIFDIIKVYQL